MSSGQKISNFGPLKLVENQFTNSRENFTSVGRSFAPPQRGKKDLRRKLEEKEVG